MGGCYEFDIKLGPLLSYRYSTVPLIHYVWAPKEWSMTVIL